MPPSHSSGPRPGLGLWTGQSQPKSGLLPSPAIAARPWPWPWPVQITVHKCVRFSRPVRYGRRISGHEHESFCTIYFLNSPSSWKNSCKCKSESALNLYETRKVRTVKAGTLEKLVGHLVPAFQGSDLSYVTVFLCTYRAFTTTQQVLDLLFER